MCASPCIRFLTGRPDVRRRSRRRREAYISTKQSPTCQEARVSCPHEHPWWAGRPQEPSRQGPRPALGLIGRIRGRDAFRRLAHDGTRIRRPALWCIWCPDSTSTTTLAAYSIGRAVGPATTRNQVRRRLRALLREREPRLTGGMLMIGATSLTTELTFDQLGLELDVLLERANCMSRLEASNG